MKTNAVLISTGLVATLACPLSAQTPMTREQRDSRYQIVMMEGVLQKAVEHGAALMRDRLRTVLPADMLLSKPVRVRGIRLESYGVIFDIDVPELQSAPLWSLQTLDQNNLGLDSALDNLRALVAASGDPNARQALQRLELSVAPMPGLLGGPPMPSFAGIPATGSAASTDDNPALAVAARPRPAAPDPALGNPTEAYRTEIKDALMEAMLDHSRGLGIGPNEWLVVAAGSIDDQPSLAGVEPDQQPMVIRIKGSDLADFLGDKITHDEARQRMVVKVF